MTTHHTPHYSRLFFGSLFIILAALAFFIVRPFIAALLAAAVLAYTFFPVHRRLTGLVRSRVLSALLVSVIVVIIMVVPLALLVHNVTREASYIYLRTQQKILAADFTGITCPEGETGFLCGASEALNDLLQKPELKLYLADLLRKMTQFIASRASDLLLSVPRLLLNIFITMFTAFYLFLDGPTLMQRLRRLTPLKRTHQHAVFKQIDDVVYALIFGSIITALIQGAFGALGFWIFKVQSPLLWGIIMAIAALIPVIGTAVIWLPTALFKLVSGYAAADTAVIWQGFGLLLFGTLVISQIDNILRPLLISGRANVHPVLILLGALGGLTVFGVIGFIIGPLALALFKTFFELYEQERGPHAHG
jgi:predicted PurR-regulated permease PerM